MASNVGRMGFRSGSPSFLVVGLSLVIVVLLYSYWSVSSRNSMLLRDQTFLQDRLRLLSSQKSKVEQKYVAARSQMTDVEKAKRKLEAKDLSSSQKQAQLDSKIKGLENELLAAKEKFQAAQMQEEKSRSELSNLKSGIESTNKKFQEMKVKAQSVMDMHLELKEKFKLQSQDLMKVKNEREMLKVQLDQAKGDPSHQRQEFVPKVQLNEGNENENPGRNVQQNSAKNTQQKPMRNRQQFPVKNTQQHAMKNSQDSAELKPGKKALQNTTQNYVQKPVQRQVPSIQGKQGTLNDPPNIGKKRIQSITKQFHRLNHKLKHPGVNDIKSIASTGLREDRALNTSKPTPKVNITNKLDINKHNNAVMPSANVSINTTQSKEMQTHNNATIKAGQKAINASNSVSKRLVSTKSVIQNTTLGSVLADNIKPTLKTEPVQQGDEKQDKLSKNENEDEEEEEDNENEEENPNKQTKDSVLRGRKFGDRFGMKDRRKIPQDE